MYIVAHTASARIGIEMKRLVGRSFRDRRAAAAGMFITQEAGRSRLRKGGLERFVSDMRSEGPFVASRIQSQRR